MRKKPGTSAVLPVLAAAPVANGAGLDLTAFNANNGGKPDDYNVFVSLAGGVAVELIIYVRDANGWAIAGDTGNLGMLGGQALATGKAYNFPAIGMAGFLEAALVEQNKNGAVVTTAKLTPVLDPVQG